MARCKFNAHGMCRQVPRHVPALYRLFSTASGCGAEAEKNAKRNGNILIATSFVVFPLDSLTFFPHSVLRRRRRRRRYSIRSEPARAFLFFRAGFDVGDAETN